MKLRTMEEVQANIDKYQESISEYKTMHDQLIKEAEKYSHLIFKTGELRDEFIAEKCRFK